MIQSKIAESIKEKSIYYFNIEIVLDQLYNKVKMLKAIIIFNPSPT